MEAEAESRKSQKYGREELLNLRDDNLQALDLGEAALELETMIIDPHHSNNGKGRIKNNSRRSVARQQPVVAVEEPEEPLYEEEEYEEISDDEGLRKPALYVDGEPDFESGSPQDGFEFLRRVRWEEARCEQVKYVPVSANKLISEQTVYMPSIPPIEACDPELLPSKDWEAEFISDFSKLREEVFNTPFPSTTTASSQTKLPHFRDRNGWRIFCLGTSNPAPDPNSDSSYTDEESTREEASEHESEPHHQGDEEASSEHESEAHHQGDELPGRLPYLSILLKLDEVTRASLLRHHISWLDELRHLPEERAVWLYALFAVLDTPVEADTSAAIRDLLRKCSHFRASRSFRDPRELGMLNMLITIASRCFGQGS